MYEAPYYTEIQERGGKRYLFDSSRYCREEMEINQLSEEFGKIAAVLQRHEYPDSEEWQRAIANEGENGLKSCIIAENDKQAARLKIPRYVAAQWRRQAVEDCPAEMWAEVRQVAGEIARRTAGLRMVEEDIIFKGGKLQLDTARVLERQKEICSCEITPQIEKEAQALRELTLQIRGLIEGGADAMGFIQRFKGNYLAPREYPQMNEIDIIVQTLHNRHTTRELLKAMNPNAYYKLGGQHDEE